MPLPEPSTCYDCNGLGHSGDDFCEVCMGQGSLPIKGVNAYIKKHFEDVEDKLNDIFEKLNE